MTRFDYVKQEISRQLSHADGLLGVLLLGSISANMDAEDSDYDLMFVVDDEVLLSHPEYRDLSLSLDRKADCWTISLSELQTMDRHGYDVRELLHAQFPMDKGGVLRAAVNERIHYPTAELPGLISARLDSYYDGVFRSLKCFRRGFSFGGYQMAARSMEYLVETLWAINGLVMPFLNRAPYLLPRLEKLPFSPEETRAYMERIACDADVPSQLSLLDGMIAFMECEGYRQVLLDWEGVLEAEADLHRR